MKWVESPDVKPILHNTQGREKPTPFLPKGRNIDEYFSVAK
jgi:hypothetical protein